MALIKSELSSITEQFKFEQFLLHRFEIPPLICLILIDGRCEYLAIGILIIDNAVTKPIALTHWPLDDEKIKSIIPNSLYIIVARVVAVKLR